MRLPLILAAAILATPAAAATCDNFYSDKCAAPLSTGVRMTYVEVGPKTGTPVVFLHGYTDSALEWVDAVKALAALDPSLRLLAVDQRGAGGTELPDTEICRTTPGKCVTGEAHVADVIALLDALKLKKAVLVGHSMGSYVAREAALAHPDRIEKLILIGTGAPVPGGEVGVAGIAGAPKKAGGNAHGPLDVKDWQAALAKKGVAWPQGAFNVRLIDIDPHAVEDLAKEWDISAVAPAEFSLAISAQTALVPFKYWGIDPTPVSGPAENLDQLTVPTMVLWGTQDGTMTKATQDTLIGVLRKAATHPGMSFVWKQYGVRPLDASGQQTDDIGHEIVWEAPSELAKDLDFYIHTGKPTPDLYRTGAPADIHKIVTEPGKAITVSSAKP